MKKDDVQATGDRLIRWIVGSISVATAVGMVVMTVLLTNISYEATAQPQVIIVLYQPPSPK